MMLCVAGWAASLRAADGAWMCVRVTQPASLHYWAKTAGSGVAGAKGFVEKTDKLSGDQPLLKSDNTPGGTLLFIVNMIGAKTSPNILPRVSEDQKVESVQSGQHGTINFPMQQSNVVFGMQVDGCDIVFIQHK